ncbi:MAG: SPOR domain-containing protein [Zoogloeaceae bacterium]|jgi:hypothetical protein|nr:SPOR domain-containing protein [Zoogloeaceae bacterium]
MTRSFFLLLVFANLAVYVWATGYLGGRDEEREPERLQKQLLPEQLKTSRSDIPAEPEPERVCQRAGPLEAAEAEARGKRLAASGGQAFQTAINMVSYWVYIPAADGKPPAKELAALRQAGFKQFSVIQEKGPHYNAVTIGLFPTEQAAKERMTRLVRNNIKSAKLVEVNKPTGRVILTARGTYPVLEKALAGLNTVPVECPKK